VLVVCSNFFVVVISQTDVAVSPIKDSSCSPFLQSNDLVASKKEDGYELLRVEYFGFKVDLFDYQETLCVTLI
jgi:hypothetical protein